MRFRPFPTTHPRRRMLAMLRDRRGVSTIEYGLILALIVLAMFAALSQTATVTVGMWNDIAMRFKNAI